MVMVLKEWCVDDECLGELNGEGSLLSNCNGALGAQMSRVGE